MEVFEDFKRAVLAYYQKQLKEGKLSNFLLNPSPGNIRKHCEYLLQTTLNKSDLQVFQEFLNAPINQQSLEKKIKKEGIDRFKPVQYFLNGKTTNPNELIPKLVAILIDFQPRPYTSGQCYLADDGLLAEVEQEELDKKNTEFIDNKGVGSINRTENGPVMRKSRTYRKSILLFIGIIGLSGSGYFILRPDKQCMYWNQDHYVAIGCKSELSHEVPIIALNEEKLLSFKKITRLDTLSELDENKVWYSKINHEVEFFTAPGFHPLYSDRSLKAATAYIIEKYANPLDTIVNTTK